ncbi:MAG: transporter [Rhodospirillaceae bacterium]|nr:transporter [Rhodospirillaceae bacterium]|tara:strand:- start:31314 stop:32243 length:930 start_codon:yes stop_codon:yes gene_type:complete
MLAIATTILPIFLLIVAGYVFKRTGFPGDAFWAPAEKLTYYVLLPALIIRSITESDLSTMPVGPMALTILSLGTCMIVLALIIKPILRIDGPAYTSVLQGATRINAYICFAIGDALYGPQSVALCAYFLAVMMPFINTSLVPFISAYAGSGKPNWARVPVQLIQNPIIIGCAIGWAINTLSIPMPDWLMTFLSILDRGTLPIALLCIGAGLVIVLDRSRIVAISTSVLLKLCVMPIVAIVLCHQFGITGLPLAIVVLYGGAPASPASYILARQMGGDAPLMAAILSVQTILAAITLPPVLAYIAPLVAQ